MNNISPTFLLEYFPTFCSCEIMASYYTTCVQLCSSLEELKDLSDKPEIMDLFLTKLESVSKQFIRDTHFQGAFHFTEKTNSIQLALLVSWGIGLSDGWTTD